MHLICTFALHTTPSEMTLICLTFCFTIYALAASHHLLLHHSDMLRMGLPRASTSVGLHIDMIVICFGARCMRSLGQLAMILYVACALPQQLGECMIAPCHTQSPFPRASQESSLGQESDVCPINLTMLLAAGNNTSACSAWYCHCNMEAPEKHEVSHYCSGS